MFKTIDKALDNVFDYEVDDWQTMTAYAYFGMFLATLLSVAVLMFVMYVA